jgi:hypothetical protein
MRLLVAQPPVDNISYMLHAGQELITNKYFL